MLEVKTYDGKGRFSSVLKRYLPSYQPQTNYANSTRLDALMRAGNIYLSLRTPSRSRSRTISISSTTATTAGRPRPTSCAPAPASCCASRAPRIRAGFSSASSGVLGGVNALGGGGSGPDQGNASILSGFNIQAAGSNIPNLEPLAFVSWSGHSPDRDR